MRTAPETACIPAVFPSPEKKKEEVPYLPDFFPLNKSDRRGSNPRSRPWQGRALPTTPLSHICERILNRISAPYPKAGDGNRTHVSSLEGWCSTIELHPQTTGPLKPMPPTSDWNAQNRNRTSDTRIFSPLLYQLSYLGLRCLMHSAHVCNMDYFNQFRSACQEFF